MKKILVTGANGFVGQHLVKELAENGMSVVGIGGEIGSSQKPANVDEYFAIDLSDYEQVKQLDFDGIDGVVHLAGLAAVGPSFDDPMKYINANIGIQTNLFERALAQNAKPRFIIVSSGTLYDAKAGQPLSESSSVLPSSPYAVSKQGQEQMAKYYSTRGFECIIARPFNHIGPGQGPGFIVPDLAQQIIDFSAGSQESVLVGNLDSKRDYTDVRDIAKAYRLLLEKGIPGETYNICSGVSISGHEILSGLANAADCEIKTKEDPAKMRPSDTPEVVGDRDKITKQTGWEPQIPLSSTLADVISERKKSA